MKYLFTLVFLVSFAFAHGQNERPQANIVFPLNGSVFSGEQVSIVFVVSGAEPRSARILLDDRAVQLITEIVIGENTAIVDVPNRDCKITVIVQNEFGAGVPATVNIVRDENIFKPSLYILAIGVSNYDDPNLRLLYPAKDAADFTQALIRQAGLLYESVDVRLLTDRRATAENIREGFQWLQTETTNRDIAMLYISGHGINNNVGDFFFMPVNADVNRILATCVGHAEIKNTVSAVAGKLLVFMDACHSGNILGDAQQRSATISRAIEELTSVESGAVVFTSSTGNQLSLESPEWNNGAFTKALVEGLNGAADLAGRNVITVRSLDYYLANRVKDLTQGRQAPTTIIPNSVADFPVAIANVQAGATANATINRHEDNVADVEQMLVTNGKRKVYLGDMHLLREVELTGIKALQFKKSLNRNEMQNIMANTTAWQMYERGFKRNRNGNIAIIGGAGLIAGGVAAATIPFQKKEKRTYLDEWDGNYYDYYHNYIKTHEEMGIVFAATGVVMTIAGVILKNAGKKSINQSVNVYNNRISRTNIEWNFNFTGNEARLAIRF